MRRARECLPRQGPAGTPETSARPAPGEGAVAEAGPAAAGPAPPAVLLGATWSRKARLLSTAACAAGRSVLPVASACTSIDVEVGTPYMPQIS